MAATIHASAVLVGARAVLIRGPSGSGKSRLALALLQAAERGALRFARLVADDRAHVEAVHGRLLVRPAPALAGMIEVRGPRHPARAVRAAGRGRPAGGPRRWRRPTGCPDPAEQQAEIEGITLPRLAVAAGDDPLTVVLAYLHTPRSRSRDFADAAA